MTSSVPFLKASSRQLSGSELVPGKPGTQYEVRLSLADDAPVGPVSANLTVKTDHPKAKEVTVKVYGVVRSLIHVTPSQVQFGTVDAQAKPGRNLIVVNNRTGDAAMEVTGASVDDGAFDADDYDHRGGPSVPGDRQRQGGRSLRSPQRHADLQDNRSRLPRDDHSGEGDYSDNPMLGS